MCLVAEHLRTDWEPPWVTRAERLGGMVIWSDPGGIHVAFDGIDPSREIELLCADWWEHRLTVAPSNIREMLITFAYKVFKEDPARALYDDKGAPRILGESGFGTEHAGPRDGVEVPFVGLVQSGIDLLRGSPGADTMR